MILYCQTEFFSHWQRLWLWQTTHQIHLHVSVYYSPFSSLCLLRTSGKHYLLDFLFSSKVAECLSLILLHFGTRYLRCDGNNSNSLCKLLTTAFDTQQWVVTFVLPCGAALVWAAQVPTSCWTACWSRWAATARSTSRASSNTSAHRGTTWCRQRSRLHKLWLFFFVYKSYNLTQSWITLFRCWSFYSYK